MLLLLLLSGVYAVSDERTRLAIAAMAQAKQDAAVVKHLAAAETAELEAERLYLARWKNQLMYLSEAAEVQAVKQIAEVNIRRFASFHAARSSTCMLDER